MSEAQIDDLQKLFDSMWEPEDLDKALAPYLEQGEHFAALRHPLVYSVPYFPLSNKHLNQMYKHKLAALDEAAKEHKWHTYVFLHERPYRIEALQEVLYDHMVGDPQTVWDLIGAAWVDSENIYANLDAWRELWDLDIPHRAKYVMDDQEREALAALPDQITVYRGFAHKVSEQGLSWTTDRDKAIWFAKRYKADNGRIAQLATGTVAKANVLAHYTGRNESEIVALPEDVEIAESIILK